MNDPIQQLTDKQLARAWESLVARVGPGWDWPALVKRRPAAARSIARIRAEGKTPRRRKRR